MNKGKETKRGIASRRALVAGVSVALGLGSLGCGSQDIEPKKDSATMLRIVPKDSFQVEQATTIAVGNQEGLVIDGTEFSSENIQKEVRRVRRFAMNTGKLSVRYVNDIDTSGDLRLSTSLLLQKKSNHAFVIVKDDKTIEALTGAQVTAATTISGDARVSYLSLLPGNTRTRFGEQLSPEGFNVAVETCNNLVDVTLSDQSQADVTQVIPEENQASTLLLMKKLNQEAVCNSYALGAASADAKLSYTDYSTLAEDATLQNQASLGFTIPYIVFSRDNFSELG